MLFLYLILETYVIKIISFIFDLKFHFYLYHIIKKFILLICLITNYRMNFLIFVFIILNHFMKIFQNLSFNNKLFNFLIIN